MENIGEYLGHQKYTLRSGAASGSDSAFEKGCDKAKGLKEIYLPWKNFNYHYSKLYNIPTKAFTIARKFHPAWDNLSDAVRNLHARNSCQILGEDLKTPSLFVICYTEGGWGKGGTGQAIRIAIDYDLPILDLGTLYPKCKREDVSKKINIFLRKYMK